MEVTDGSKFVDVSSRLYLLPVSKEPRFCVDFVE